MSIFQRRVLETLFAEVNAIRYAGVWVFKADIRSDDRLAALVYWHFCRDMD